MRQKEVERAGKTELARKRPGKRPSASDREEGEAWSRRGPREAQREIERGRGTESQRVSRARGGAGETCFGGRGRDEVREAGEDAERDTEQR